MIGFVTLYAVPAVSVKYDCRFCNENFYCSELEMEEKNVDERIHSTFAPNKTKNTQKEKVRVFNQ